MRARLAVLLAAGTAALGGCAYGGPFGGISVGMGYGSGYGGYYGGYGGYDCYDPYSPYGGAYGGYGGYDRYGFPVGGAGYGDCGYGNPYWGWYGDYYYPGTGYYVYDRYRRPHRWDDRQKRYWTERRERAMSSSMQAGQRPQEPQANWSGFERRDDAAGRRDRRPGRDRTGDQPKTDTP